MIEVPLWLQKIIDQVVKDDASQKWPNDEYPALAFNVQGRIKNPDSRTALLQSVIDEVEKLQEALQPFRAIAKLADNKPVFVTYASGQQLQLDSITLQQVLEWE